MYPQSFEYVSPASLDEAIDFLSSHEGEAKILSGGQSLIPLLKMRLSSFGYLVDITGIQDLKYLRKDSDHIHIGSLVTTGELEESSLIRGNCYLLSETAAQVADPQVRNMGTIGGNVVHGDPGNDFPSAMMALGAKYVLHGPNGRREVPASDFYLDSYTTDVHTGEILTEVIVPVTGHRTGASYVKHKRRAGDFSIAAVAVYVSLSDSGTCDNAGIAVTSLGPINFRAKEAENFLVGERMTHEIIEGTARVIVDESRPTEDAYGSVEFKKQILQIVAREALEKARDRAVGV